MPEFLSHVTGTPVDPAAGTAGVRTLGTGASQAAAGNHTHTGVAWDIDPASANGVQRIRHSTSNYLPNSSLEHWGNGTTVAPNGWVLAGDVTISRITNSTIGTYAAQLVFGTANTGEFYADFGVSNLVDYTYSCYVERTSGTGTARLVAQQEGSPYTEYASVALPTGSGQQLAVLTVKPTNSGTMRFSIKSGNGVASTWRVDECMAQESKGVATTFEHLAVDDTNDQTIYGAKTFATAINVPTPGSSANPATKLYVDSGFQPLDSDLTTIAGLTATTDNMIVSVSSAWASRTPAQVKTTLALNNVDNTSNATERAATRTLTNARVTKRVGSAANNASLTIDSDSYDAYALTAMSAATTMNNPSGTPTDFQPLMKRFKDNGTARAITWSGSQWRAIGITLPTTTVISKTLYVLSVWNAADSKWDALATGQEA